MLGHRSHEHVNLLLVHNVKVFLRFPLLLQYARFVMRYLHLKVQVTFYPENQGLLKSLEGVLDELHHLQLQGTLSELILFLLSICVLVGLRPMKLCLYNILYRYTFSPKHTMALLSSLDWGLVKGVWFLRCFGGTTALCLILRVHASSFLTPPTSLERGFIDNTTQKNHVKISLRLSAPSAQSPEFFILFLIQPIAIYYMLNMHYEL